MLRYGTITEIDATKGLARVKFTDDSIVSDWLQMVVRNSAQNKSESWFDVNEFVVCMMDGHLENGVILGAMYTRNNTPPIGDKDVVGVTFPDGTEVSYNRASSTLSIKCVGDVYVDCVNANVRASEKVFIDSPESEFSGDVKISGALTMDGNIYATEVKASGSVKSQQQVIAFDGTAAIVHLSTHIHPTPSGPSSPPTPGT